MRAIDNSQYLDNNERQKIFLEKPDSVGMCLPMLNAFAKPRAAMSVR